MDGVERTRARRLAGLMGLALVSFAGCGGETAEEAVMEEASTAAAPAMPEADVVDQAELGMDPAGHEGMVVRLNGITVTSVVGTSAFWTELPTDPAPTPFLVHTASTPAANARVDVVGTVSQITPAVVEDWVSSGAITEGDRLMVEFATHYLEAEAIQPSAGM